eukprot:CAMPEP_0194681756 /NCGR_PEP_ID=MMETSP0295-20121207/12311_1 /TAXON_ID=39354 /ORGANISM="Heterosigma akashiwo, Strain CCMP2393" /LENGTH=146 /DNA_ID=CAMNT_0039567879 /DNA_START=546 /DNA_END=987 /DNA_ORIENTATION=+
MAQTGEKYAEHVKAERCKLTQPHKFNSAKGETIWPHNVLNTLNSKDVEWNLFPNIQIIFLLLAVLPVTTASVERSMSLLRRLKTWLRSSMGEVRLNALALMMANPDFDLNTEKVLHEWYMAKNRNIHLAFEEEQQQEQEEEETTTL